MDLGLGTVLGAVASELLHRALIAMKDLKDRDVNLQRLEQLLQRLQPFVQELKHLKQKDIVALAREWLDHLEVQLETALAVIHDCSIGKTGILSRNRLRSFRKFKTLFQEISRLISEATIAQWATGLSTTRKLSEGLTITLQALAEMRAIVERQEEHLSRISEAFESEPTFHRQQQVRRTVSEQTAAPHALHDKSLSSALYSWIPNGNSSSSIPRRWGEQLWNRAGDIAEPTISYGGDSVAQRLISNLTDPDRYKKWVGLWAMGGAGKTFTAKKVFNHERVRGHFTGGRFWVTISNDQPPTMELLKQLFWLLDKTGKFPNNVLDARIILKGLLNRDKVLLILDDVWNSSILRDLDLVTDGTKSVILVTTRDDNILKGVSTESMDIEEIPKLSEYDSWELFCWHAFFAVRKTVPTDLEDVARAVALECKGLPLALQVIGSAMTGIPLHGWEIQKFGKSIRGEWELALEKLKRANAGKDEYEALYNRLQISVDILWKRIPVSKAVSFLLRHFLRTMRLT